GDIGLEAYHIAKVMTTSERAYLSVLTFLHTDFREAVACVVGGETCPVMEQEGVTRILCEVSELYELHQEILRELEQSITQWYNNNSVYILNVDWKPHSGSKNC
ncbi:hypothetical protein scyTo_0022965, partial [Scyliorhinus torazame]|nr:hypothetical protein [Scyliorhinus torazame]